MMPVPVTMPLEIVRSPRIVMPGTSLGMTGESELRPGESL
jgi:hypothetical protein